MFGADQDDLSWSRLKETAPETMFATVRDGVFPFIRNLGNGQGSTHSHHRKDALFLMPPLRVLANVVDQLDGIDMTDRDTKGDLYEYMPGKIAAGGQGLTKTGLTEEGFVGKRLRDIFPPEIADRDESALYAALDGETCDSTVTFDMLSPPVHPFSGTAGSLERHSTGRYDTDRP